MIFEIDVVPGVARPGIVVVFEVAEEEDDFVADGGGLIE
jgi:hypothetical protein